MKKILIILLAVCIIGFILSLGGEKTIYNEKSKPILLYDAADTPEISIEYALYLPQPPADNPSDILTSLINENFNDLHIVQDLESDHELPAVKIDYLDNAIEDYPAPDPEYLEYFGYGLDEEQVQALPECNNALILFFIYPGNKAVDGLQTANNLALAAAEKMNGLLWDAETRQLYSPEAWQEYYIISGDEDPIFTRNHIAIHAYQDDNFYRAITLGMSKFGLPDIVINNYSWSVADDIDELIVLLCQSIFENDEGRIYDKYDLDIKSIRNNYLREIDLVSLEENATGKAKLLLKESEWEEGDPLNTLLEITFDRYPGKDLYARQDKLVSTMFGWTDQVFDIKHTDELNEASEKAREQLPALHKLFEAGLQPDESIHVKAPFAIPDRNGGNEWMWVEIISWEGKKIKGILLNQPFDIPNLQAGQMVEVSEDDTFDYIHYLPDGTEEGNTTSAIIKKMGKQRK